MADLGPPTIQVQSVPSKEPVVNSLQDTDLDEKSFQIDSSPPVHKEYSLVYKRWTDMLENKTSKWDFDTSKAAGKPSELASQGSVVVKY